MIEKDAHPLPATAGAKDVAPGFAAHAESKKTLAVTKAAKKNARARDDLRHAAFVVWSCFTEEEQHMRAFRSRGRGGFAAGVVAVCSVLTVMMANARPVPQTPQVQSRADVEHSTIFYKSGGLRIEAYLYLPRGEGPFPLVIYNHGSREGAERSELPFPFIGRLLTEAGYAVLVPERRGYGKSDGPTFQEEVGQDKGTKMIERMQAEAGDVLAALDYLKTVPSIDSTRIAIMGFSFGGIVTILAASNSNAFFAAIDQASGSLSWARSPALQKALPDAAGKIRIPLLCQVAENDATTAAVKSVYEAAKRHKAPAEIIVYPPFTPAQNPRNTAPGHLIFTGQGVAIWGKDVVDFLAKHVRK